MRKLILTLAAAAIATLSAGAAGYETKCYTTDRSGNKTYWSADGQKLSTVQAKKKGPAKAVTIVGQEESKRINVEIKYDETKATCNVFCAGLCDALDGVPIYKPAKNLGEIEIPSGVSGLLCFFSNTNKETNKTTFWVNFQDIANVAEGSTVVFDIDDCVHKISYSPVDEDGNFPSLRKCDGGNLIADGDFDYGFSFTTLNHVNDGQMWYIVGPYKWYFNEDHTPWLSQPTEELYINDCGPNFYVGQFNIFSPAEGHGHDFTLVEMPVYRCTDDKTPSEVTLKNDASRFQRYVQKWTRSPYSVASNDENLLFSARMCAREGNLGYWGISSTILAPCSETNVETVLNICSNDPNAPESELLSMITMDIMPESSDIDTNALASMFWQPGDNGRKYLPINLEGDQINALPFDTYCNFVEDNYSKWLLCYGAPNPHLAFTDNLQKGRLGNNTPIISTKTAAYYNEIGSDLYQYYYGLVGRYGEGNSLGTEQLIDWQPSEMAEDEKSYKYDENNLRCEKMSYENVLIDGEIDGQVDCELYIKKVAADEGADFQPPCLTWLSVKDGEGYVTDRFDSGTGATIELYAADWYLSYDWSLGEYGLITYKMHEAPSVKVEYAPYGDSNFTELETAEVPEKFFDPGWGNFFETKLDGVDRPSENGWYDVRVTLEDANGNKHVQTISPVFKIGHSEGIEGVADGFQSDAPVIYYNLQGVRVENPTDGVFIERHGNKVRKVIK